MTESNSNNEQENNLPAGWVWSSLEDCVEILDSQRIPINATERAQGIERKSKDERYPYYGATGQVGWIDDFIFDEELLLLGEDGAPFLESTKDKAYIIRGKSWVNNHAHVLRAISGLTTNHYLMHYLNYADYHDFVTGTTRLKLNQSRMRKIPIPLAPFSEQERMVAKIEKLFSQLDAGIVELDRIQANLARYKASVLKAACEGRLVPTEAEMARAEGRDYESGEELLQRILVERKKKWKEEKRVKGKDPSKMKYQEPEAPDTEGLPELPEGWVWARVGQISHTIQYGTSEKANLDPSGIPVLRMGNIQDGNIDFGNLKYLSYETPKLNVLLLDPGDILFNRTNSAELVGKTAVYKSTHPEATFASYLIRVKACDSYLPELVSYYINSFYGRKYIAAVVSQQVGQANVNGTKLANMPIIVPPLDEQIRVVAELERRLSIIEELETAVKANLTRAERVRQAILKRAFEGKLMQQKSNR